MSETDYFSYAAMTSPMQSSNLFSIGSGRPLGHLITGSAPPATLTTQ